MPPKPKNRCLPRGWEVVLYTLPTLLPLGIWFGMQGRFKTYQASAADVSGLASGLIVLSVFIVCMQLRISLRRTSSHVSREEHEQLSTECKNLQKQIREIRQVAGASTTRNTNIPQRKTTQVSQMESFQLTQHSKLQPFIAELDINRPIAAVNEYTVYDILNHLKQSYVELVRHPESNADRLANNLLSQLPNSENSPSISIIYRDAAAEDSQIYQRHREDVQIASASILAVFPGGYNLLFPAPIGGQDCFYDVKAFTSGTPFPSQKRSNLAYCEPAKLDVVDADVYRLSALGKLDFKH